MAKVLTDEQFTTLINVNCEVMKGMATFNGWAKNHDEIQYVKHVWDEQEKVGKIIDDILLGR